MPKRKKKKRQSLSKFETMAQRLVEGSFKKLFGEQLEPHEVAARLARAMEDSRVNGKVADYYTVQLHPVDLPVLLEKKPHLSDELSDYLVRLAHEAEFVVVAQPRVVLIADASVGQHQVRVQADHGDQSEEQTTKIHSKGGIEIGVLAKLQSLDAYLIIAGRQHVSLDQPLLTLGRRTDNDIVLDSAMVSRQHAQIRWRYGRFVLFDLSQRGRTLVNDKPITQHALQPGDVIALSDTFIVYGEGGEESQPHSIRSDDEGLTLQLPKNTER